ncbi:MAG: DNA alkylation repair protein [Bacillota bacterium]|nr:DNA alkylation repair protein [Bacillota bacterium]
MTEFQDLLFMHKDESYAQFQANLTPNIPRELFIGVRVPVVRKLANDLWKQGNYNEFLHDLPHVYYDENMLHGILLSKIKDLDVLFEELERFLPYVDNWAVCDTMNPKVFLKHKERLLEKIQEWIHSEHTYTIRFGIGMLMGYFLNDDFKVEYLDWVSDLRSEEYYVNMMIAWYFATALTKQWDSAILWIEQKKMDTWTHNKAIQKAIESRLISEERKNYLRTLKIK